MEWFINDFYKSFIILKVNYTDCSFFTISVPILQFDFAKKQILARKSKIRMYFC